MAEQNFYNTYLTFGLTSAERKYLEETERNSKALNTDRTDLVELHWVDCEEFSDVLATPAFMILIRLENLTDEELDAFNECFGSSEIMIFSLGEFLLDSNVAFYPDFDLLNNNFDQLQLIRTMLIMEHRNCMVSHNDIKFSSSECYVAVDISYHNGDASYEAVRIKKGKIQSKERIRTENLSELKDWIGNTTVILWQRKTKKYDISEKTIDLYLFSATEFPILSAFQDIDDRLRYFFADCDEKSNCLKIACLFLIVLINSGKQ